MGGTGYRNRGVTQPAACLPGCAQEYKGEIPTHVAGSVEQAKVESNKAEKQGMRKAVNIAESQGSLR